jgi:hypothetical protein
LAAPNPSPWGPTDLSPLDGDFPAGKALAEDLDLDCGVRFRQVLVEDPDSPRAVSSQKPIPRSGGARAACAVQAKAY